RDAPERPRLRALARAPGAGDESRERAPVALRDGRGRFLDGGVALPQLLDGAAELEVEPVDLLLGALRERGSLAQRRDGIAPFGEVLVAVALEHAQIALGGFDGVRGAPRDPIALPALRRAELLEADARRGALALDLVDLFEEAADRREIGDEPAEQRRAL